MSPWVGYTIFIVGNVAGVAIRVPHDTRSKQVRVVDDRKGMLEVALLAFMTLAIMLPLVVMATSLLSFADYSVRPACLALGTSFMALYLWVFRRSHADLGENWSPTLQVRESHRLVATGIYRRVRHPMYAALYLLAIAQALLVPNLIAGPAMLVAFTAMFLLRLAPEEGMMIDKFGDEYRAYAAKTKRLIPGIW